MAVTVELNHDGWAEILETPSVKKCIEDAARSIVEHSWTDAPSWKVEKGHHGVMRKNIIEYEFRRGNASRKIRFEVECTLEEFAEFLDVIEPFGDEWAARIGR